MGTAIFFFQMLQCCDSWGRPLQRKVPFFFSRYVNEFYNREVPKPDFHVIVTITEKSAHRSQRSRNLKPLSSDGSDQLISQNALHLPPHFNMASSSDLNTVVFMEEVQKYDCLYNKFSKYYKNKYKKLNCWSKIGEKFDLEIEERPWSCEDEALTQECGSFQAPLSSERSFEPKISVYTFPTRLCFVRCIRARTIK